MISIKSFLKIKYTNYNVRLIFLMIDFNFLNTHKTALFLTYPIKVLTSSLLKLSNLTKKSYTKHTKLNTKLQVYLL